MSTRPADRPSEFLLVMFCTFENDKQKNIQLANMILKRQKSPPTPVNMRYSLIYNFNGPMLFWKISFKTWFIVDLWFLSRECKLTISGPAQLFSAVIFKEFLKCIFLTLTHTSELAVQTNMGSGVLAQRCFSYDFFFFFFLLQMQYQSARVGMRRWAGNRTTPATAPHAKTPAAKILGLTSLGGRDLTTASSKTLFVATVPIEIPGGKTAHINPATWVDLTVQYPFQKK